MGLSVLVWGWCLLVLRSCGLFAVGFVLAVCVVQACTWCLQTCSVAV